MAGMRLLLLFLLLLFPLPILVEAQPNPAQAQSNPVQAQPGSSAPEASAPRNAGSGAGAKDWNAVLSLSQGDDITVTSAHAGTLRCKFRSASETTLNCDTFGLIPLGKIGDRAFEFSRTEIVKVRHRHFPRDRNITIAAFAAVGCALGATGGGGLPGCVLGGLATGVVGGIAALILLYWLPGNTIYENAEAGHTQPGEPQPQARNPAFPMPAPAE
jgi:hypothetical protein